MHKRTAIWCLALLAAHVGASCPQNHLGDTCSNAGSCNPTTHKCTCKTGYSGDDCATNTLKNCPRQCSGHGQCAQNAEHNTWSCACDIGFSGIDCHFVDGCGGDLKFCSGHGQCHDGACVCERGWEGADCSLEKRCVHDCNAHGRCDLVPTGEDKVACQCDEFFTGQACETVVVPQSCISACSGHGICAKPVSVAPTSKYALPTPDQCSCDVGFVGPACGVARNMCGRSCGHGTCSIIDHQAKSSNRTRLAAQCVCNEGFIGENCNIPLAAFPCASLSYCSGRGECITADKSESGRESCRCMQGFHGDNCALLNPQHPPCQNSCSGHGQCSFHIPADASVADAKPLCKCHSGWEGADCSFSRCAQALPADQTEGPVCNGHGICELSNSTKRYACVCDAHYSGLFCDVFIKPCAANCTLHGKCVGGECICNDGWDGPSCMHNTTVAAAPVECCPFNCSDNGVCDVAGCRCVCNKDWAGRACNEFAAGDELALL